MPIILMGLAHSTKASPAVTTTYQFADTTPLATGNWLRVSTAESGIYEITYDELRAMGFADPSKVAVYGLGGAQRDLNFVDNDGNRIVEDVIKPIRIMHANDKILFYAEGPEKLSFNMTGSGTTRRGMHKRESLNIYSDNACYFLTDSHPIESVHEAKVADKVNSSTINWGYAFVYHEKDLKQGKFGCGQLYWGENLEIGKSMIFNIEVPYAVSNSPCALSCDVAVMKNQSGNLNIKHNTASRLFGLSRTESQVLSWTNILSTNKLKVDENHVGTGILSFTADGAYSPSEPLAIDYWALTYPLSLEYAADDASFTQQYIAFAERATTWKHYVPDGSLVWDITDPSAPVMLETDGKYFYKDNAGNYECTETVVFNPLRQQKRLNPGYVRVNNQNLHALKGEPVDMIIFSVPDMMPYAQRIAELHKTYDGQRVEVFDPQTVYNEFTSGNPDPMAFRMLAKMLYQNEEHRLKNILFIGPVYADYKNITGVKNRPEGMIAFQQNPIKIDETPAPVMDFYGIMTDRVPSVNSFEAATVSVGVGLLPINSAEEGEIAVAKIKEYLEKQDFSGLVNESMSFSCAGDGNLHDNQAIRMGILLQSYENNYFDSELAHRNIWLEATGDEKGNEQIINSFNAGKLFSVYYGHAGEGGIGSFSVADALNLKNKEQGFLFLAACDLCKPDLGVHGVGDMGVIRNERGFIGVVCATRSVMSNFNDALARNFASSMFMEGEGSGTLRESTPTVGEVYARSKDITINESEPAYLLIGDPGLTIPIALGDIELTVAEGSYRAGDLVEVKGRVINSDGSTREDYNGYATVKLMEPERIIPATTTTNDNGTVTVIREKITYNDSRLLTVKADVKNGEFTVKLPLPAKSDNFLPSEGKSAALPILAGAYDPTTRLGTSGRSSVMLAEFGSTTSDKTEKDDEAPVVTLGYDNAFSIIKVDASDNAALLPGIGMGGGITLTIDGTPINVDGEYSYGVAVTSYSGTVSAARIGAGTHTAVAYATDLAGNRSKSETFTFVINERVPITLSTDKNIAIDNIAFRLSNDNDDTGTLNLIIADYKGNVIADEDVSGNTFEYDTTDVPAGMYRAAVRQKSAAGTQIRSNWVEFTVID